MASTLRSVTFDADEPRRLGAFWGDLLGRDADDQHDGVLLSGDDTQVGLRFVPDTGHPREGRAMHLHLTSDDGRSQQGTVATALDLGASHVDVGQRPGEGHVVLADPEGNPFCVIEPHNAYLAGTGLLGEVACDGTRAVGVFWSEALGWPLVWDRGGETAIQSPAGGTKVAWGGPPVEDRVGPNRQRLELVVAGDLDAEVTRLVALGAVGPRGDDGVSWDPDGNEFVLVVR